MIEWMNAFALCIHRFRLLLVLIGALSLGFSLYIVFSNNPGYDRYLLLSVTVLAWILCLFGISNLLRSIPKSAEGEQTFFRRQLQRLKRLAAWTLSVGLLMLCFALVYFTYKAIVMVVEGV